MRKSKAFQATSIGILFLLFFRSPDTGVLPVQKETNHTDLLTSPRLLTILQSLHDVLLIPRAHAQPFTPGETLDPNCAPGTLDCFVDTTSPAGNNQEIQWNDNGVFGSSSTFIYDSNTGNVGIGTSTPLYRLTVSGDLNLTGSLRTNGNPGLNGYILQSTGTGLQWVATSSLGLGGGSSIWGSITGTLSSQTDLQNALNSKYDASNPSGFTSNTGTVTSITAGTGLSGGTITGSGTINLSTTTLASLGLADSALQNITGFISAGSNVSLSGTGVSGDPYVINATVGSSTGSSCGSCGAIQLADGLNGFSTTGGLVLDMTGNARGTEALDIQSYRSTSTQVASGDCSIAFGRLNTVSGVGGLAIGNNNCVTGLDGGIAFGHSNYTSIVHASAFGEGNSSHGNWSSAFGVSNAVQNHYSSAFGYNNTICSCCASVFGSCITNTITCSTMLGPSNTAKLTVLSTGETIAPYFTASTTATSTFPNIRVTQGLYDASGSIGTPGYVLQSSGTSTQWVATSSLGISGSSSYPYAIEQCGTAMVGGDKSGCARGACSLDIQAYRFADTQVTNAGGCLSSAVGVMNTTIGNNSSSFGYCNCASVGGTSFGSLNKALNGSAFGQGNTVCTTANAFGYGNTNYAPWSSAFGMGNTVCSGTYSAAFGSYNVVNSNILIFPALAFGANNSVSAGLASAFGINLVACAPAASVFGGGGAGYSCSLINSTASSTLIGPHQAASLHILSTGETRAPFFTASTTATSTFPNIRITQGLYDSTGSIGGSGCILQSTGTSTQWVATSSLGLGGDSYPYAIEQCGTAMVGGDKSGCARGVCSLDVQSYRSTSTRVSSATSSVAIGIDNATGNANFPISFLQCNVAVGIDNTACYAWSTAVGISNSSLCSCSSAFGHNNVASEARTNAFGRNNCAISIDSSAFGNSNRACGIYSSAFGFNNTVSSYGYCSSTFGAGNTASTCCASVFGSNITNSIACSVMLGPSNTAKLTVLSTGEVQAPFFTSTSTATSTFNGPVNFTSGITLNNSWGACGQVLVSQGYGTDPIWDTVSGGGGGAYGIEQCGTAMVGGDKSGCARGSCALDVQSFRYDDTRVASGGYSIAIGGDNRADGNYSSAIGNSNTTSGYYNSAFGICNTAINDRSSAFGYWNVSCGHCASAVGANNTASGCSSSAFGTNNTASNYFSTAFGAYNRACGDTAVAVGVGNCAPAEFSAAFGMNLVNNNDFSAMIGVESGYLLVHSDNCITTSSGAHLTTGGAWTDSSSRDKKTAFTDVNKQDILQKISNLNLQTWTYKTELENGTRHLGPVAEEFYASFGLGADNKSIAALDTAGVALVGIQALKEDLDSFKASLAVSPAAFSLEYLLDQMQTFGISIVDGVVRFTKVAILRMSVSELIVKNEDNIAATGVTIYDRATGEPVCVFVEHSVMKTEVGVCDEVVADSEDDIYDVDETYESVSVPSSEHEEGDTVVESEENGDVANPAQDTEENAEISAEVTTSDIEDGDTEPSSVLLDEPAAEQQAQESKPAELAAPEESTPEAPTSEPDVS